MSPLTTSVARHQVDSDQGHEAFDLSTLHHNKKEITMNPKQLAAQDDEWKRLWNEMAQREVLEAQRFIDKAPVFETDLRETRDPGVPYDPITEIDFLTQEEVKDIGDLE